MNYKIFTWVDTLSCTVSIILLLFVCIYPYRVSKQYSQEVNRSADAATMAVTSEKWSEADSIIEDMLNSFYERQTYMRYFFDHEDVDELEMTLSSAQALISTQEDHESLAQIERARIIANFLFGMQTFTLANLF